MRAQTLTFVWPQLSLALLHSLLTTLVLIWSALYSVEVTLYKLIFELLYLHPAF